MIVLSGLKMGATVAMIVSSGLKTAVTVATFIVLVQDIAAV